MHNAYTKSSLRKYYDLVSEGITGDQEVKRALKQHVQHVLCPDLKPDLTDRSYYPTTTDVQNNVYRAQRACQLSKLDQVKSGAMEEG